MRIKLIPVSMRLALLAACCSVGAAAAQEGDESLAAQARDPTASLTAFQIRYDYTSSLHGVSDADLGAVVLQPIIPFKLGEQRHIARITTSIVTHAPNLSGLGDIAQNPLPPNFIPTQDTSGLGDTALLDVLLFDASWGRWGIGPVLSVPTATDKALGSGKWSLGPAAVGIAKGGGWQGGALVSGLFSFAGEGGREDVSVATIQPFASYDLGDGWSVGLSELTYTYNFNQGKWLDLPIGGRIEKLVKLGSLPVRLYFDTEYNLNDSDISPEWTFRFAFVPLF